MYQYLLHLEQVKLTIVNKFLLHSTLNCSFKATAGEDFENGNPTAFFPAGETESCVRFNITDDNLQENDETFTVTFTPRPGMMSGDHPTATVTIIDNDGNYIIKFWI